MSVSPSAASADSVKRIRLEVKTSRPDLTGISAATIAANRLAAALRSVNAAGTAASTNHARLIANANALAAGMANVNRQLFNVANQRRSIAASIAASNAAIASTPNVAA